MVDRLAHREIEIVVALAEGLTNREIAERVGISEDAVASDLSRVLRKLGLRNRVQVAVWAVKQGLY
jgi:DNA-binding NarL/FixJ family response regulator